MKGIFYRSWVVFGASLVIVVTLQIFVYLGALTSGGILEPKEVLFELWFPVLIPNLFDPNYVTSVSRAILGLVLLALIGVLSLAAFLLVFGLLRWVFIGRFRIQE